MEEGDPVTSGPDAGYFIDDTDPGGGQFAQCRFEVGDAEGHVVESRAPPLQEAGHRALRVGGLEELDGSDEGDLDALGLDGLHGGTCLPRHEFEERTRFFDGSNDYGDVVEREAIHQIRCPTEAEKRRTVGAPTRRIVGPGPIEDKEQTRWRKVATW